MKKLRILLSIMMILSCLSGCAQIDKLLGRNQEPPVLLSSYPADEQRLIISMLSTSEEEITPETEVNEEIVRAKTQIEFVNGYLSGKYPKFKLHITEANRLDGAGEVAYKFATEDGKTYDLNLYSDEENAAVKCEDNFYGDLKPEYEKYIQETLAVNTPGIRKVYVMFDGMQGADFTLENVVSGAVNLDPYINLFVYETTDENDFTKQTDYDAEIKTLTKDCTEKNIFGKFLVKFTKYEELANNGLDDIKLPNKGYTYENSFTITYR